MEEEILEGREDAEDVGGNRVNAALVVLEGGEGEGAEVELGLGLDLGRAALRNDGDFDATRRLVQV